MCGICGIVEAGKDNRDIINRMCEMIAHRGPENQGIYHNKDAWLGHRWMAFSIDAMTDES